jgi:drug/metabolite transporter (DMT)-like permease
VVTALAFVLWYSAVGRLGPGRAGLFTGLVPIVATVGGLLLGGPVPRPAVWIGVTVVLAGLSVGLARRKIEVSTTVDSPAEVRVPSG